MTVRFAAAALARDDAAPRGRAGAATEHFGEFLAAPQRVDWLEPFSDNWLVPGGKPLVMLDRIRIRTRRARRTAVDLPSPEERLRRSLVLQNVSSSLTFAADLAQGVATALPLAGARSAKA